MSRHAASYASTNRDLVAEVLHWLGERKRAYQFCVLAIYALPILTFTTPTLDRSTASSSFVPLSLAKISVLAFCSFGGAGLLYAHRKRNSMQSSLRTLLPFVMFFGWSLLTVAWSPKKAYSIGHAGELFCLLTLAALVGAIATDRFTVSKLLRHLAYSLLGFGAIVMTVHLVDPNLSGLDRTILHDGGDGIVHPTASGAASALGIVVAVLGLVVMRFPWAGRLLLCNLIVNGPLVLLSHSRTASLMAVLVCLFAVGWFASTRARGAFLVAGALVTVVYLVFDPGFSYFGEVINGALEYLSRGQNLEQIQNVSGRREMWSAIWAEYQYAPIGGHGYFITSRTGELLVWNILANHPAHNVALQVLSSTGLIGLILFLGGLVQIASRSLRLLSADLFGQRMGALAALMTLWYLGWSLGCASFMGPLRSESVVFFTLVGLCLGERNRIQKDETRIQPR